jgi:hypothetical protein
MGRSLKIWLGSLLVTVAFVWVSFHWFDKPIAMGIYNLFGGRRVSTEVADRIVAIPLITAVIFVLCGLFAVSGRRFSKFGVAIALCDISVLATIIIKDQLKFVFGRTWPDTWGPGIVSFVRDGVYGFHFFQFGKSFESFPSCRSGAIRCGNVIPKPASRLRCRRCPSRRWTCGAQSSFPWRCRSRKLPRIFGRIIHGRFVAR